MRQTPIKRHPDLMTAHLANGGDLDGSESAWVKNCLAELRTAQPGGIESLAELKRIYTGARVVQGSVVGSRLALPAMIEAGRTARTASFPQDLEHFGKSAAARTEAFLTGAENGSPRAGNDYPAVVKRYIAALAGMLCAPYMKAFTVLQETQPQLLELAWDADELQRLTWGHIRAILDRSIPAEEVARYRRKPLREGTDELLAVVLERTGVSFPARIVQRDDWPAALLNPRQDASPAVLNGMKFFVENAEIGMLYYLGSLLTRLALGQSADDALRDQIRHGARDIAAGTHRVTHNARFQSRIGARPNDYRSFGKFLRDVREQLTGTFVGPDGVVLWSDSGAGQARGWCPARNRYEPRDPSHLGDLARQGRAAVEEWREYGRSRFGVEPVFDEPTPAELFGSVVVFVATHDNSPLRPDGPFLHQLSARLDSEDPVSNRGRK